MRAFTRRSAPGSPGPGPWVELARCPAVSALLSQSPGSPPADAASLAAPPHAASGWGRWIRASQDLVYLFVSKGLIGRRLRSRFLSLNEEFSTSKLPGGQLDGEGPTRADCVTLLSALQRSVTGFAVWQKMGDKEAWEGHLD